MGILDCASGASVWKGYNYFKEKKVKDIEIIDDGIFSATVSGSSNENYYIELNVDHPRKSKCNCPHADGKRIICKHIIATYFTIFPEEAESFYQDAMNYQEEEEKHLEILEQRVIEYVCKMKKADLSQALLELLFDGPDWQYDRFIREHEIEEDSWI